MCRIIFLSLLYLLSPGLSEAEVVPRSRSETDTSTTTSKTALSATPPSLSPIAAPPPTAIVAPGPSGSSLAKRRNAAAASVPTQRPSGLFNSYTCVAIKPYVVCGIVAWTNMNCTTVMDEYEFLAGNCCPLNDYGAHGCRLEVNGPNSFCSYKTRYDRRYYSYLIAPSNTGTCKTSQYEVNLPPTPPPTTKPRIAPTTTTQTTYGACFQASYVSCAGTTCAGTTTTSTSYAFRRAYNRCARSSSYKSSKCVHQASLQCNAKSGRPPLPVCEALATLGPSGKLVRTTCVSLRRRCRAATESVVCN